MTFDDFLIDNYIVTSASRDDAGGFYVHFTPQDRFKKLKIKSKEGDSNEE